MKNKSFLPPKKVRENAKKGLELRKELGKGGLSSKIAGKLGIGSGVVRATNLALGKGVSYRTVKRMKAYFSRHHKDKRQGWDNKDNPSRGYIAWLLWGGDEGRTWANQIVKEVDKVEKKEKRK